MAAFGTAESIPQQTRRLSPRTAQVRPFPALTAVKLCGLAFGPETSPAEFEPQHDNRPPPPMLQVCPKPRDSDAELGANPQTP
jgi:hypothetical protein